MMLSEEIAQKVAALEARVVVSDAVMAHLRDMYNIIGAEAWYDPASETVERFANQLWPHMKALNEELKFRS